MLKQVVQEELQQSVLSLVDVKLEQNSKSVNCTIHVYDGVTDVAIQRAINNAIDGLLFADKRLKEVGLKQ